MKELLKNWILKLTCRHNKCGKLKQVKMKPG